MCIRDRCGVFLLCRVMPIVRWPLWFVMPCYAMIGCVRVMSVYKGYPDMSWFDQGIPCWVVCPIFFPASRCVHLLRVLSSVKQPSATLSKYVFYSTCSFCLLCHLYPTSSRDSFVLYSFSFFFVALVSRVAFFLLCRLVPGTLALDLPTLNL